MAYSEHVHAFGGCPTENYEDESSWQGPGMAYRLREDYDDQRSVSDRLESLLQQPESDALEALIIGSWSEAGEAGTSEKLVKAVAAAARRLPNLKALFFGEMTYEECEISWIQQTDVSPLLVAYPGLEIFRVRGGMGLSFSRISHPQLRELGIETGGLSRSTIRELFLCEFPGLEKIELLLGEPGYGFDGSVEDLQPLLSGRLYPKLKYLGLQNSEIANDLAAVVVNSPIVERIETLDLSMGNLDDEGVRSLTALAGNTSLKRLDITHNYASPETVQALVSAVPFEVIAGDPPHREADWRPILHAE